MRAKTSTVAVIVLVVVFGGIAMSSALGLWTTVSAKEPARFDTGEFAGEYNPADIRGSYTFGEVSELFGVPLEDLGRAFAIQDAGQLEDLACNELEALYAAAAAEGKEVGTDSVRVFVALYKGLPITLNDATYLLTPAVGILKNHATLTEEQLQFLESHTIAPIEGGPATGEPETEEADTTIKGSTTFQDLLNWGLQQGDIESAIGGEMPDPGTKIRDYATEKGIEFSTWREALQALVDAAGQ